MILLKVVSECFNVNIAELVVVTTLHSGQGVKVMEGQSFYLLSVGGEISPVSNSYTHRYVCKRSVHRHPMSLCEPVVSSPSSPEAIQSEKLRWPSTVYRLSAPGYQRVRRRPFAAVCPARAVWSGVVFMTIFPILL